MSTSELQVTLIQTALHWENGNANRAMFEEKIRGIGETDLIVLPEMFTTGFTMNAAPLAEDMNGATVEWMQRMAVKSAAVICGSVIVKAGDSYFNRLIWMRPDGSSVHYDKRHLFSLAQEQDTYTQGTRKLVVQLGEWTICPQVCYDLRFPVWSRNAEEYDLLLNVANWPEKRSVAWRTLLRARAIENQCYVVAVNRVGDDGHGVYHAGNSAVIDPMGETIWEQSDDEAIETVRISRQTIYETRRKFPFLRDRDDFAVQV